MALIKEPLDVDFFVEAQPLSDTERKAISDYIRNYKKEKSNKKKIESYRRQKEQRTINVIWSKNTLMQ